MKSVLYFRDNSDRLFTARFQFKPGRSSWVLIVVAQLLLKIVYQDEEMVLQSSKEDCFPECLELTPSSGHVSSKTEPSETNHREGTGTLPLEFLMASYSFFSSPVLFIIFAPAYFLGLPGRCFLSPAFSLVVRPTPWNIFGDTS